MTNYTVSAINSLVPDCKCSIALADKLTTCQCGKHSAKLVNGVTYFYNNQPVQAYGVMLVSNRNATDVSADFEPELAE